VIQSIEHHVNWIGECIAWLDTQRLTTIEATAHAEADWMAHVQAMAEQTVFLSCNSWYMGANVPGKPRLFMPLTGGFPPTSNAVLRLRRTAMTGFRVS
jgi:cyclohexanone monooxygenase